MKLEEHVGHTEELFGIRGEDIHQWLDGFFDTDSFERLLTGHKPADFNPYDHRKFRHCVEGLEEAYEKFESKYTREEIKNIFETHVKDDYNGYLPTRDDFANGTFTEKYHDVVSDHDDEKILSYEELSDYFKGKSYSHQKKEAEKYSEKFATRIVLPTVVAMLLFISSIFIFVVPVFEKNMLDQKKLMIKELTATAASVITYYLALEKKGELTPEEAKQRTVDEIKKMRYDHQNNNYFFIIDMTPKMIMHPYRPELTGKDLSNYTDRENKSGKKLFVEFVRIVKADGEGYLRYYWQWKDDPNLTAPKLSYVKGIPGRNWIIGTGVYINDIDEESSELKIKIFKIFGVITAGLFLLIAYLLLQSNKIENNRKRAEAGQKEVKDRYRALVESSNEGYLLTVEGRVVYSNYTLQKMLSYSNEDLHQVGIWNIILPDIKTNIRAREHIFSLFENQSGTGEFEAVAADSNGNHIDVILTTSRIFFSEKHGYIISIRPITRKSYLGIGTSKTIPADYKPIHDSIIKEIRGSDRLGHIVKNMNKLPRVVREMIDIGTKPETLRMVIGSTYDEVVARCIELSIEEVGTPPTVFAFLSLGSNARHEMTMFSDQDNAIIFQNNPEQDPDKTRQYFLRLGDKICGKLNTAGYQFCPGGIMASNPKWCLSETEWHKRLKNVIKNPNPDGFLEFNVFFDLKCTYGDEALASSIHTQIQLLIKQYTLFINYYGQNALIYKPPLNVFGGLRTERQAGAKTINIKDALRPIEIFARLYALKHDIYDANTIERLRQIMAKDEIAEDFFKETVYIFNNLWHLRFFNQIVEHTDLRKVNDDLDIEELNELEVEHLKQVVSKLSMLRRKISLDFLGRSGVEI